MQSNQKKILIVVDMQNDFITGALGSEEARAIVPKVCEKIKAFDGETLFTRDTHGPEYPETQEGKTCRWPTVSRGPGAGSWNPVSRRCAVPPPLTSPLSAL